MSWFLVSDELVWETADLNLFPLTTLRHTQNGLETYAVGSSFLDKNAFFDLSGQRRINRVVHDIER